MELIITYGIIGWGGSFDNTISQLQIIKLWLYSTARLYTELNKLPVKKIYLNITAIYLKNQNKLQPIPYGVNNIRKKQFFYDKNKKTNIW